MYIHIAGPTGTKLELSSGINKWFFVPGNRSFNMLWAFLAVLAYLHYKAQ